MKNNLLILLIILLGVVVSGCQTTTTYYQGAKADGEGVVNLSARGTEPRHWQDLYIMVDYTLNQNGEQLEIEGALSFSDNPKALYTRVWDLKLKLFLLDQNMRVVSYRDIARTLSNSLDDKTKFTRTLQLRKDVVSYTFGYEGSFVDDDPESPSTDHVWKLPKRQKGHR
ncbi:MAG: hypothetical protein U9R69_04110 [Thermodesulfobacteriota bacterium]|nr:hypothetical protein [Thermodesulfobacteriota bacterium]